MKKIKKIVFFTVFMTCLSFSFNSVGEANKEMVLEESTYVVDDLRCVVRDKEGNKIAACWFCNCQVLTYNIYSQLYNLKWHN